MENEPDIQAEIAAQALIDEARDLSFYSSEALKINGKALDDSEIEALRQIKRQTDLDMARLRGELDHHLKTPEEYLDTFNFIFQKAMNDNRAILGDAVFTAIFGEMGPESEIIDRKLFLSQYQKSGNDQLNP